MQIFRVLVGGANFSSLIPHDLNYFRQNFVGKHMSSDWAFPGATIAGKSKKLPDFMSWMVASPLISIRAKEHLQTLVGDCVQFLPPVSVRNKDFYPMNVVCVAKNILDYDRSEIFYSSSPERVPISLDRAVFQLASPAILPPIFKVATQSGFIFADIFVSARFVSLVDENKLTGIRFLDPTESSLLESFK